MQVVYQCTRCYSTVYSRHYTSDRRSFLGRVLGVRRSLLLPIRFAAAQPRTRWDVRGLADLLAPVGGYSLCVPAGCCFLGGLRCESVFPRLAWTWQADSRRRCRRPCARDPSLRWGVGRRPDRPPAGSGGPEMKELAPSLRCRWRRFFATPFRRRCTGVLLVPPRPSAPRPGRVSSRPAGAR